MRLLLPTDLPRRLPGVEIRPGRSQAMPCSHDAAPPSSQCRGYAPGRCHFYRGGLRLCRGCECFCRAGDRILAAWHHFPGTARGKEIVAEARCVRSGRSTCFYTVTISDELGTAVAHMTVNGFCYPAKDALISARGNSCLALWAITGGAAVSTPVSTLPQSEFCFFRFFALTLVGNIDKVL